MSNPDPDLDVGDPFDDFMDGQIDLLARAASTDVGSDMMRGDPPFMICVDHNRGSVAHDMAVNLYNHGYRIVHTDDLPREGE